MALAQAVTPPVARLLDALDAEQRAAATLPDGPAQIIAPAGSGKTTTLIEPGRASVPPAVAIRFSIACRMAPTEPHG